MKAGEHKFVEVVSPRQPTPPSSTTPSLQHTMSRPSFAQLAAKLMQQRTAAGFGGAGGSGPSGGAPQLAKAAGGGLGVVLLAVAGLTINASMFNGASPAPPARPVLRVATRTDESTSSLHPSFVRCSRRRTPGHQVHEVEWSLGPGVLRGNPLDGE